MSVFPNTRTLYQTVEALFHRLQEEDAKADEAFTAARLLIRLNCTEPEGTIILNGRSRPFHAIFGPKEIDPDLDIWLSGDTLHQILSGEIGLKKAVARKKVRVQGPTFKTFTLAPLFQHGQRLYPQILRENDLDADS
jgi:putative sterol carrier protein